MSMCKLPCGPNLKIEQCNIKTLIQKSYVNQVHDRFLLIKKI